MNEPGLLVKKGAIF